MSRASNWINVVDVLQNIASSHRQIHSFGLGEVANINTSGTIDYVNMWVEPGATLARMGEVGYKFGILIMDILENDLSNLRDVLNDTNQIILDVAADIRINGQQAQGAVYPFFMKEDFEPEFIPFMERFNENVAGWRFNLEVWTRWNWSECDIPKN